MAAASASLMPSYELKVLRLDQLNIPAETLRQSSSAAADAVLKESLENNEVLVPFVVSTAGKNEYIVWDGTRRTRLLRELGAPGSMKIPALVTAGGDSDSVIAQVNINQARERLTDFAEAEALRQLVNDHGWQQNDAAKKLLKSKGWASKIMKVWALPKEVIKDLRTGKIFLAHAMVLSKYADQPKILEMLHKEALTGNINREQLAALGVSAENKGIQAAKKKKPKTHKISEKSWVRLEPLQNGNRLEVHYDESDSKAEIKKAFAKILDAL